MAEIQIKTIQQQFKESVCAEITLEERGINRYVVNNPFIFEDGDNLVIVLKCDKDHKKWLITDEAHTLQHIGYFMDKKDLMKGTRKEIIEMAKSIFEVQEYDGEFFIEIKNEQYGGAFYNFVQCLLKIIDVTFLERKRIQSTFFEDFETQIKEIAHKRKLEVKFNYFIETKDKTKMYPIDCYIKTKKDPLFIFAINADTRCMIATISILTFEKWGLKFHSSGVFENQQNIGREVLARFSDAGEKQISSLDNMDRLDEYIQQHC